MMMDSKTYLNQVRLLDSQIDGKLRELDQLKSMVHKITPTIKQDVVSCSGDKDKIGSAISKIIDLEKDLNFDIDTFVDKKKEISSVLDQVTDAYQYQILHKRYFEYITFEGIACDMHMTFRNVLYIHGKALSEIDKIRGIENEKDSV